VFSLEEIANLLTVLVLLVGLRLTNRLGELAFWVFLGRSAMVFLTNDVLFPVSYMPDQLGYLNCASMRRGGDPTWCMALAGKNVLNASWFFAYFPLPFIVSVRSTSLMNAVLITLLYAYLDRRGFFSERARLFYLFYPSFVLYAAVGARDVLIMFCMCMAIYNLIEKRNILLGLCWVSPLLMIKLQNAFMALVPFAMTILAGKSRSRMILAILLGAVFALAMLLGAGYLADLNKYRTSFYAEDGGVGEVPLLSSSVMLPVELLMGAIGVVLMPLPWQAGKAFQLIQSIENLVVMGLMIGYWRRPAKPGRENDFMNLKIFLVSSMVIYGAVVFNYGTAARYRFPFVLLFIIFADRLTQSPKKHAEQ
jgi:hypothetical protein